MVRVPQVVDDWRQMLKQQVTRSKISLANHQSLKFINLYPMLNIGRQRRYITHNIGTSLLRKSQRSNSQTNATALIQLRQRPFAV